MPHCNARYFHLSNADCMSLEDKRVMFPFFKKKQPIKKEEVVYDRRGTDKPVTTARIRKMYERPASFTNLLPWTEYLPEQEVFVLEDGVSVGALLHVRQVGTEARPEEFMEGLRDSVQAVMTDAFEEEDDAPWIVQFYIEDIPSFRRFGIDMDEYIVDRAKGSQFSTQYMKDYREHLKSIAREEGLFIDEAVTGGPWQGRVRKVRCVIYRKLNEKALKRLQDLEIDPIVNLNETVSKFTTSMAAAGLKVRRLTGEDFYEWMVRWFNPKPPMTDGDVDQLLDIAPYPGDDDLPFGSDLAESFIFGMPASDNKNGFWYFDGMPHRCVSIQGLRRIPEIGHVSAERLIGDRIFALFDKLPEHTTFVMTIVIKPQDQIRNHISLVKSGSVGDSAESVMTDHDCDVAALEIARGNKLFPMNMALFIRAENTEQLKKLTNQLNSTLISNGLQPIMDIADLLGIDSYIRNLPMCYDPVHDEYSRRSRLVFSRHIANLLPVYGRSTGTGHHGIVFYNRGAEPMTFDPLNKFDRKKNAHMLIIGPTGAGKSAMMVYLMMQMAAMYRPRIYVIEAGNSFGLLGNYFAEQGLTVNQMSLQPSSDVSLPPFSAAIKLLEKEEVSLKEEDLDEDEETDLEDENRDILGEMEIAARIMITGGEVREDEKMSRADRMMIRQAIIDAARAVRDDGRDQVLTEDVVKAFREIGKDSEMPEKKRERAQEMSDGLELFCSGLAGQFFNSPGRDWPETDVTIMDVGILAREGYEDQLTVAYIGLMNNINNVVERHQHDDRPAIVLTDEGHIITTNPLLAPYVVKITKMWRKLGAWFWIATQNLEDFPNASKKMLNMMEWWLCLVMPKEEIEQIARFKSLTSEQKSLLLSARKEPGKFVEGVVLADQIQALFRSVPPPLVLALAMTEKYEKAERGKLMEEHGISELDAARMVADRIAKVRGA